MSCIFLHSIFLSLASNLSFPVINSTPSSPPITTPVIPPDYTWALPEFQSKNRIPAILGPCPPLLTRSKPISSRTSTLSHHHTISLLPLTRSSKSGNSASSPKTSPFRSVNRPDISPTSPLSRSLPSLDCTCRFIIIKTRYLCITKNDALIQHQVHRIPFDQTQPQTQTQTRTRTHTHTFDYSLDFSTVRPFPHRNFARVPQLNRLLHAPVIPNPNLERAEGAGLGGWGEDEGVRMTEKGGRTSE
jgi:hypothetical protein